MIDHASQNEVPPLPHLTGVGLRTKKQDVAYSEFAGAQRRRATQIFSIAKKCFAAMLLFSTSTGIYPDPRIYIFTTLSWLGFIVCFVIGLCFLIRSKAINFAGWVAGSLTVFALIGGYASVILIIWFKPTFGGGRVQLLAPVSIVGLIVEAFAFLLLWGVSKGLTALVESRPNREEFYE